jgi:large subunit ribosomal protein L1
MENIFSLFEAVTRLKPPSSKGTYVKGVAISKTMSPGVRIDPAYVRGPAK